MNSSNEELAQDTPTLRSIASLFRSLSFCTPIPWCKNWGKDAFEQLLNQFLSGPEAVLSNRYNNLFCAEQELNTIIFISENVGKV